MALALTIVALSSCKNTKKVVSSETVSEEKIEIKKEKK
tara:strand:+ start:920 stop:1033 length:114 start_codon:yes stop_codon:yes gene_type:complete